MKQSIIKWWNAEAGRIIKDAIGDDQEAFTNGEIVTAWLGFAAFILLIAWVGGAA